MLAGLNGMWSCKWAVGPWARGAVGEGAGAAAAALSGLGEGARCGDRMETGERYPKVGESGRSAPRGEIVGVGWTGIWCWDCCLGMLGWWYWLRGPNVSLRDESGERGERGETGETGEPMSLWFRGILVVGGWVGFFLLSLFSCPFLSFSFLFFLFLFKKRDIGRCLYS